MSTSSLPVLPVLSGPAALTCDGCGACCEHLVMPPFMPDFYCPDIRNEEFDAFKRDFPELAAELKAEYERRIYENDWPDCGPCFWFDTATKRFKHYEARPEICRDFAVGGSGCLRHRRRVGLPCPDRPLVEDEED